MLKKFQEAFFLSLIAVLLCGNLQAENYASKELWNAVWSGNLERAEHALENGADANYVEPGNGISILHAAVKSKNLDILELILDENPDVNVLNHDGEPALKEAVFSSEKIFAEMAELILDADADVNLKAPESDSILMRAIENSLDTVVDEILDREGVELNVHDAVGRTALMLAARQAKPDLIKRLLKKGAHASAADLTGKTVLMHISDVASARLLLAAGANLNALDFYRQGVLAHLRENHRAEDFSGSKLDKFMRSKGARWQLYAIAPGGLKIRSGPGLSYDAVTIIPFKQAVDVLDIHQDFEKNITVEGVVSGWAKVRYRAREGWAFHGFLVADAKYVQKLKKCAGGKISFGKNKCLPLWFAVKLSDRSGFHFDACAGTFMELHPDGRIFYNIRNNAYPIANDEAFNGCLNQPRNTYLLPVGRWKYTSNTLHLYFKKHCHSRTDDGSGKIVKENFLLGPAKHVRMRLRGDHFEGKDERGKKVFPPVVYC